MQYDPDSFLFQATNVLFPYSDTYTYGHRLDISSAEVRGGYPLPSDFAKIPHSSVIQGLVRTCDRNGVILTGFTSATLHAAVNLEIDGEGKAAVVHDEAVISIVLNVQVVKGHTVTEGGGKAVQGLALSDKDKHAIVMAADSRVLCGSSNLTTQSDRLKWGHAAQHSIPDRVADTPVSDLLQRFDALLGPSNLCCGELKVSNYIDGMGMVVYIGTVLSDLV
mgnify:CR=1 FL=1|jgi:hypothetical protein